MDKFIVSARKYRPQTFDTVVGQSHVTTTLKNAIKNNQLAHAFLFCGPRGVGKTTCARILAKTINCENIQPDGEACNVCNSCKSFNEGISLNIHELDAASNNSVDDIRSLVEQVRFAPQGGKYKVYIVDEVHMLSANAFNAFLKTLEEPPPYAIFILATTEKHKILPTILSRCQIFDFKRITTNDTIKHLEEIVSKENINAEKSALHVIAQKSEGCMRDALSILDKIVSFTNGEVTYHNTLEHLNILDDEYYFRLLDFLLDQNLAEAMLLFDEINRKGFEEDVFLNGFTEFMRNLLVCKNEKAAMLLNVAEGMQLKYIEVAAKVSPAYIVSTLNIFNEAEINYKMARNKRLHVEIAIIKLNFLQQALELTVENGTLIKKKRIDGPVSYKTQSIQSLQPKSFNQNISKEAKLFVDTEINKTPTEFTSSQLTEEVINIAATSSSISVEKNNKQYGNKKNLLEALQEKYGSKYHIEEIKEPEALNIEKLKNCWEIYIQKISEQKKHSSVNTFRSARLNILNETKFVVTVNAVTQQKFIEQEKTYLCDLIQQSFNNRNISFDIIVEEGIKQELPAHMTLNSRQKFEKIAAQYPLVKELKDKLKLNIDY